MFYHFLSVWVFETWHSLKLCLKKVTSLFPNPLSIHFSYLNVWKGIENVTHSLEQRGLHCLGRDVLEPGKHACGLLFSFHKSSEGERKGRAFCLLLCCSRFMQIFPPSPANWEMQDGCSHVPHYLFCIHILIFILQICNRIYVSLTEEMLCFGICGKSRPWEGEKALTWIMSTVTPFIFDI